MAITVEVNDVGEETIRKNLESAGDVVEETGEETVGDEEKPQTTEVKPDAEKPAEKSEAKAKPAKEEKKEETPKPDKKEWDDLPDWAKQRMSTVPPEEFAKLPDWAQKRIAKQDTRIGELRDTIEHERAVKPSASAGGERETVKEKPQDESEINYSGIPEPQFEAFEKSEDPYRDFTKAHAKWAKNEAVAQIRYETQMREHVEGQRKVMAAFGERQTEASELISDYGDVVEEATDIKASDVMQRVIYGSEVGPYLLYHLAQHPDECQRLFAMGNTPEAAKAMGRLEVKVEGYVEQIKESRKKPGSETPKKKTASSAPKPENPVSGSEPKGKTLKELAGGEGDGRYADVTFSREYEKKRIEQRRGR